MIHDIQLVLIQHERFLTISTSSSISPGQWVALTTLTALLLLDTRVVLMPWDTPHTYF